MSFANRQSRRKSYNIAGHAHELHYAIGSSPLLVDAIPPEWLQVDA